MKAGAHAAVLAGAIADLAQDGERWVGDGRGGGNRKCVNLLLAVSFARFVLLIAPNKKGVCAVKTSHHGLLSCSWALPGQRPWLAGPEDLCGLFLMLFIQRWT
jgi:hypothetical protein